ncbi:hypothetical protein RG836_06015 [Pseudomonas sp. SZMC_28357]|uniref:hypothetical protein n=1 Tax=Pseudomonas sp. SZMC_28357 TaxID=3074380 RepID=UPI002871640A|nr:hypothetical protein [Pseudomonas sp. SZMC_28357]MDR9750994.1 hypothetical protein [Pseudomonas sp. SZMC_28357]
MKILILDDETNRAKLWKESLDKFVKGEVVVYQPNEVSSLIGELHRSRLASRGEKFIPVEALNGFDLVIIDYDLLGLEMESPAAWATGAELAYSIRLMSEVGPVIVVNQFGTNAFDLTMRRNVSSYADVDIGSAQIQSPGLWLSSGFDLYRPWHWPNLNEEIKRFELIQRYILQKLDEPVMATLGFELEDTEASNYISYEVAAFLGSSPGKKDMTFRDIVVSNDGLRLFNILEKDVKVIENFSVEQTARVCTAILIHWLEKVVLPSQEVVADAPHLSGQLPWIVSDARSLEAWNHLCRLDAVSVPEALAPFAVVPDFLFSRPVFWAEKARREIACPEGFAFAELQPLQFCEDSSSFVLEDDASSYPSDVIAFDKKRWVKVVKNNALPTVNYEPQSYLLM